MLGWAQAKVARPAVVTTTVIGKMGPGRLEAGREGLLESLTWEGGKQRSLQRSRGVGRATSVRVPEGHDGK